MRRQDHWRDERIAGRYDAVRFGGALGRLKARRDERLVERLLAGAGPWVLDLPCGTGRLGAALSRVAGPGGWVVGADLSPAMLAAGSGAADSYGLRARASAFRLPFADEAFDAAVVLRFHFHLDDAAERVALLAELARVTRGPIVLQVRHAATLKHASRRLRSRLGLFPGHRPAPGRAALAGECERAGLRVERLVPVSRGFSDKALVRLGKS